MSKLIPLSKITPKHKTVVGNKAYRLAQLHQAQIVTAEFYVIPSSISRIDQELKSDLNKILSQKPNIKYAVRSSANCEDGITASFAGQFTSYLSLTKNQVIPAIKKCWQSATTKAVKQYCLYQNIDPSVIKMAVIIQEMVEADKGGVMFTRDIFNDQDNLIIEAVAGLGEQVVSGTVNSDKYVVNKSNGTVIKSVLNDSEPILTKSEINDLAKLGLKIEKLFGSTQDIEWAIHQNKLFVLQSRPIT